MVDYEQAAMSETSRGKKRKDPNRPRRPPSAFFLFCTAKRAELKATRPDLKAGPQLQVILGEMWRDCSEVRHARCRDARPRGGSLALSRARVPFRRPGTTWLACGVALQADKAPWVNEYAKLKAARQGPLSLVRCPPASRRLLGRSGWQLCTARAAKTNQKTRC